jgi:hypothetical protein
VFVLQSVGATLMGGAKGFDAASSDTSLDLAYEGDAAASMTFFWMTYPSPSIQTTSICSAVESMLRTHVSIGIIFDHVIVSVLVLDDIFYRLTWAAC